MLCRLREKLGIWLFGTVPFHTVAVQTAADRPRIVQYITMSPAPKDSEEARQKRITGWRERLTGLGKEEQEKEHFHGETAELTPLGRRLLGLDAWEE